MIDENFFLENFKLKIITKLSDRGYLFLIKTEDMIINDFLKTKLIEKTWLLSSSKNNIDQSNININNFDYDFVDIQIANDEALVTLLNRIEKNEQHNLNKIIYFLPKVTIYKYFDNESIEDLLSSSIYISEELPLLKEFLLQKYFKTIFGDVVPTAITEYFYDIIHIKKTSLNKIFFHISSHSSEILKFSENELKSNLKSISFEKFLDEKGNLFLKSLPKHLSIETIEEFFRAFVIIEKDNFTTLNLSLEEISTCTQAPIEDLIEIIEIATSTQFQILIKIETKYTFKVAEYLSEWNDLKKWVKNEKSAFMQYKQLETLANDYFKSSGTLLNKEQIEQALNWKTETLIISSWEEKYKLDKDLISSYILLSQNNLEESLQKQQKKRSRLLKNTIRISIAVSIAFLLSSFTALIAYLERNSAIKQQELAMEAKEDADNAREIAESERFQAIEARKNESSALKKAEVERLLAIESKGQAEIQKRNALNALDKARISEMGASRAREIAEKNEQLANEATEIAEINFKTSERLRNQQEARASALEALGHFANNNYKKGLNLAQSAFSKNITNGGFPLQSDVFYALLYGKFNFEESQNNIDLEYPAKFITLSTTKDKLAVYTINGEIRIYSTLTDFALLKIIKTGYIQSMEFINDSQILFTNIAGDLLMIDILSGKSHFYTESLLNNKYKALFRIPGNENSWIATSQNGGVDLLNYQKTDGFFKVKEKKGARIQAMAIENDQIAWAEKNNFFISGLFEDDKELLFTAPSEISSISWSQLLGSWIVGLKSGQLLAANPNTKQISLEIYAIHASQISHLKIIPYVYDTELMFSTGFDGSIYIYVLDQNLPFSTSISSRINFPEHKSWITGFVIDPEKKLAFSISNDRTLKIWPLSIEELLQDN